MNQFGNMPLHVASMYGHTDIIKLFQQKSGGAINKQLTMNGESALHLAVLHNRLSTVKLLCQYGADINEIGINGVPLIYTALFNNSIDVTRELINRPEIKLDFQLENGNTLLHLATKLNKTEIIKILLEKKVSATVYNKNGKNALHLAIESGVLENVILIVESMLASGIVNLPDSDGLTPLVLAIKYGDLYMCEYLLKKGADYKAIIQPNMDVLSYALLAKQKDCINLILRQQDYALDLDKEINLRNFEVMCQLGFFEICNKIIAVNTNYATKNLTHQSKEQKNHIKTTDEVTCYVDYICKANNYVVFNELMKNNKPVAIYVSANLARIYRIVIKYKCKELLRILAQNMLQIPCQAPIISTNPN